MCGKLTHVETLSSSDNYSFKMVTQDVPEMAHAQAVYGYTVMSAELSHVLVELTTPTL